MKQNIVSLALKECVKAQYGSRLPVPTASPIGSVHWHTCFDQTFKARVRYHWRKNLVDPGDCEGDLPMLMGLAIATAIVGICPGWIPEVQKMGAELAPLFEKLFEKGNR